MRQIPPLFQVAIKELGTEEWRGDLNNPRILEYHASTTLGDWARSKDAVPWCSSFVNWCCAEAGLVGTGSAAARSWLRWGVEAPSRPFGSVVVMRRRDKLGDARTGSWSGYHVGLHCNRTRGGLIVLSGNTQNRVGFDLFRASQWRFLAFREPPVVA